MLVVLNMCMVWGLEGDEIVGFNGVAVRVQFGDFGVFFPGLGISAMWRLVFAIGHGFLHGVAGGKNFAGLHVLRPVDDFKFVHGLGFSW